MTRIDSFDPPEANPDLERPASRPGQGPGSFVLASLAMAWRWLRRMRTALYLLGVLGLLTLLATLAPQEPNVPATVARWREGTAGPGVLVSNAIDVFGGYDVYGSFLFLLLLTLLFVSLTACLIPRFRAFWRIARHSQPPRARYPERQEVVASFATTAGPEESLESARAVLGRARWRLRAPDPVAAASADGEPTPPTRTPQVAAEKGHISREAGSLVFHTSFYVLLIAVVLGQLLGFTGQVGVIEGQNWADTAVGYWTYSPGRWWNDGDHRGFQIALDEFEVDWYRDQFSGQPRIFLSDVTITEPDGSSYQDTVGGNDPLLVDGMKIHQLDWGYAPRVVVEKDGEVIHDGFLTTNATQQGFFSGAVKAPGATPDIGLDIFLYPYAPQDEVTGKPTLTGAPWADAPLLGFIEYEGDLNFSASQNVNELDTRDLREIGGGAIRVGDTVRLADGITVSFPELRRWVGFQVSHRPTLPYLLLGSFLVLAGLIPALYAYRRRLWVQAVADEATGATIVTVGGRAFQRPQAFDDEHARIVERLRKRLAPPPGPDPGPAPTSSPSDRLIQPEPQAEAVRR